MKVLYVGDIMGPLGLEVAEKLIQKTKSDQSIDIVIAQAENVSQGKGTTLADYNKLRSIGIDFCSGGNWSMQHPEIYPYFADESEPIIRPANIIHASSGQGYKFIDKNGLRILVISLLGQIVGRDSLRHIDNPLLTVDRILNETKSDTVDAIVANFHGDYSSEKVVIGHYLDGRVSAVIGDHWHVPTNDARVLPLGTAHISDVGMCGALNSSLGVKYDSVLPRWLDKGQTRNELEMHGPRQFNAVIIEIENRKALSIKPVRQIYPE